jgi:hypothetical protein
MKRNKKQHKDVSYYDQEYKDRVVKVGSMIFNSYLADRERTRLFKLLGRFAREEIHRNWLRIQFEKLC